MVWFLLAALVCLPAPRAPTPAARLEARIRSIQSAETGIVVLTERGAFSMADTRAGARRIEGLPEEPIVLFLGDLQAAGGLAATEGGDLWGLRSEAWVYLGDLRERIYAGVRCDSETLLATQAGLLALSADSLAALPERSAPSRRGSVGNFLLGLGASRQPGEPVDRSAFRVLLAGPVFSVAHGGGRVFAEVLEGSRLVRGTNGAFQPDTMPPACPPVGLPRAVRRTAESNGRCFALLVDGSVYVRDAAQEGWRRRWGPTALGKDERISAILPRGDTSVWVGTRGGKLFLLPLDRLRDED